MRQDLKNLVDAGLDNQAMAIFVRERLEERLKRFPLENDGLDLNPHLQIQEAASQVVQDSVDEGFDIDRQFVYLLWLTDIFFPMPKASFTSEVAPRGP